MVNLARAYGIRALGPDALGLINTDGSAERDPGPDAPDRRRRAVLPVGRRRRRGAEPRGRHDLGLSSFISTGDYADVTANDVMQYWEDDAATRVCLLSLDSIGNPRKFSRITRRLTRRKPVVVFAPGRTSRAAHAGVRGGLGHAPDEAVDALFRQAGVMVVHRRGAMIDVAKIAARQPLPRRAAGPDDHQLARPWRSRCAHTCDAVGLLARPRAGAARRGLPTRRLSRPPPGRRWPSPNAIRWSCAAVNVFDAGTEDVILALEEVAAGAAKPLVGVFLDFHPPLMSGGDQTTRAACPASMPLPTRSTRLSALTAYAHWRDRDPGAVPLLEVDEDAARRVVNQVLARDRRTGRELTDAGDGGAAGGVRDRLVPRFPVCTVDEAVAVAERLGWNVALKATDRAVRGRPDQASVRRNIDTAEEMAEAWRDLGHLVTDLGLPADDGSVGGGPVVQEMAPPGVALVITSREDAAFGPIVSLGLDGIPSELLGDTVYRVPPLTTVDASAMVRDLKAAPVLFGRHGARAWTSQGSRTCCTGSPSSPTRSRSSPR